MKEIVDLVEFVELTRANLLRVYDDFDPSWKSPYAFDVRERAFNFDGELERFYSEFFVLKERLFNHLFLIEETLPKMNKKQFQIEVLIPINKLAIKSRLKQEVVENLINKPFYKSLDKYHSSVENEVLNLKRELEENSKVMEAVFLNEVEIEPKFILKRTRVFTHIQIALIIYYSGASIVDPRTDSNREADKIAKKFGLGNPTSGLQLYGKFKEIRGEKNQRTGVQNKQKMIENIRAIMGELEKLGKANKAKEELLELESAVNQGKE